MYHFDGLYYRLWGVCGIVAIIGILCLWASFWPTTKDIKGTVLAGVLAILVALGMGIRYISVITHPDIQIYSGAFVEEHRNSRIAPPSPITYEYTFINEDGEETSFYLDLVSKKAIYPHQFETEANYQIIYEAQTNIIVGVEYVGS